MKKVQAEVRFAELENARLATRLIDQRLGDPHVDKKIVIEGGGTVRFQNEYTLRRHRSSPLDRSNNFRP